MKWLSLILFSLAALGCLEDVEDPRPMPQPTLDGGTFEPGKKPPQGGTGYGGSGTGSGVGNTGSGAGSGAGKSLPVDEAWDA